MLRWLVPLLIFCVAHAAHAHKWQGDATPISEEFVENTVARIIQFDTTSIANLPTQKSAFGFLDEVSYEFQSEQKEVLRILMMFEAIRVGAIGPGGEVSSRYLVEFEQLTVQDDFPLILKYFDQLNDWLNSSIEVSQ